MLPPPRTNYVSMSPTIIAKALTVETFLTSGNNHAACAGGARVSRVRLTWLLLSAVILLPGRSLAWTNGELLIWMDNARADAMKRIAQKCENDLGIKVSIATPQNITTDFPLAAEAGKGPDIVIWAHDKVGEWADAGLIAPVKVPPEYAKNFFAKAWQATRHEGLAWAYPIAMEAVTLIYNKRLLKRSPPRQLSELVSINAQLKEESPGVNAILWDYDSAYYSWGILASAGGYVFGKTSNDYDVRNVGVATPGAVAGLKEIIALIRAKILPRYVTYSTVESLMGQGKVAMIISGPWAWSNLLASGIDFGLAPIPGVDGKPGHPFVGVSVAYVNRSSPNTNLAPYFIEHYLLTDEGLTAMNQAKPIGVPALISLYQSLSQSNARLRELDASLELGEVIPNVPEMGRFFSSMATALQIATEGRASAQKALSDAAMAIRGE
jgi:maltose/maltodextrin transport system substrate-binding protein